jgi:Ni,Fe-hydrogenase III small subunit
MKDWVIKGLRTGIVTTRYPDSEDYSPGISPGFPKGGAYDDKSVRELAEVCPTGALRQANGQLIVNRPLCIHCYRCARGTATPAVWESGFEWAGAEKKSLALSRAFRGSLHIRVIDAGSCGACLNEVKLLNNPYYNMHRLGFFITPTPRQADILLVVGPVTDHMKIPLLKAYEAMPAPKRVMAVGACALTGGIFGPSFVSCSGVADMISLDVKVPGCPPPPLAILHGLLVLTGRKSPSPLVYSAKPASEERGIRNG